MFVVENYLREIYCQFYLFKMSILVYPNLSIILLLIFASSPSLQGGELTVMVYHPLEAPAPAENTWALVSGQSGPA